MTDNKLGFTVEADTQPFEEALKRLEQQAASFGTTITGSLKSAIVSGKSLEDTLRSIALSMANTALNDGFSMLQNIIGNVGLSSTSTVPPVTPFAKGGVVSSPTYFPNGGSIGLMGEAGNEAILPLKRGADGSLGVASNGAHARQPTNITVNISTPNAASFNRSSHQISAALTRAVARGQRSN
ncbi:MAG: phage tail tape measure protein [Pseudomonadota bacterium]